MNVITTRSRSVDVVADFNNDGSDGVSVNEAQVIRHSCSHGRGRHERGDSRAEVEGRGSTVSVEQVARCSQGDTTGDTGSLDSTGSSSRGEVLHVHSCAVDGSTSRDDKSFVKTGLVVSTLIRGRDHEGLGAGSNSAISSQNADDLIKLNAGESFNALALVRVEVGNVVAGVGTAVGTFLVERFDAVKSGLG